MEPCAPACVTSLLFVPVSSSVRPGWCTDSAGLWRISQVKTCELLEDHVECDTHQVCCRCGEASRAGVPSRACEMPGARARGRERRGGRGEGPVRGGHPADVQRAVPGVGACGRPGGNTVERRGGPGESPCPPGRLVLFWGSRGGRMDRIVAPAPRAPPCHSHLARAVSLSLSCRVRRVWRPSFMVGGDQALAGGRVQVGRAPPGDTLAPQPSRSPPGNCVTCLPRVLAALLQGEEGESPPLAWL